MIPPRRFTHAFLLPLTGVLLTHLFAGSAGAQEPPQPVVESTSLLDLYHQGGWTMHLLLVFSVATAAVATYCLMHLSAKKMAPRSLVDTLTLAMQKRDVGGAYQHCLANPCGVTRVLAAALLKVNFERDQGNKVSMEEAAAEAIDAEETRWTLWVNYLNVFATLAPMLGLFGTVTGMIAAFNQLKSGQSEPADLAGGIGEAMITTAGGLIVGIPAMFFYFFFRNRLMGLTAEIQRHASFLIGVLSGEVKLSGGDAG